MKQITEDYVSYETAVLLKEKGFDEICSHEWGAPDVDKGYVLQKWTITNGQIKNSDLIDGAYTAPTQSLALKWLREVHNIHVEIRYMPDNFTDEPCYKAMIWDMNTEIGTPLSPNISYTYFETCVESALKYTLENLI